MKSMRWIAIVVPLLVVAGVPAQAAGPVDGEVAVFYGFSKTDVSGFEQDSENAGARGDLWFFNKVGVSGAVYRPSPGDEELDYKNIDVKYRFLSATRNNFVAVGAGWQTIDFGDVDTSGPRAVVEGRVSIKVIYLYGRAAWLPDLDDAALGGIPLTNGDGRELEFGVQYKPAPFVQIFGGYRADSVNFDVAGGGSLEIENKGPVVGVGFNF